MTNLGDGGRAGSILSRRDLLLTASAALLACSGCGGGGGGQAPGGTVDAALTRLTATDTFYRLLGAGDGFGVQWDQAEMMLPETQTLAAAGSASTPGIVAALGNNPTYLQDSQYLAYARVLFRTNDRTAAKSLADFLERAIVLDVTYAVDGATHALKTLTDQTDAHTNLLSYSVVEAADTVKRARAWIAAHPEVTQRSVPVHRDPPIGHQSCRTRYVMVDSNGLPFTWTDPNTKQTVNVTFDIQRFGYTDVPDKGGSWATFLRGLGGTVDPADPLPRATPNCAGYILEQVFGKSGNYGSDDLLVRLAGSGAVEEVANSDLAEEGDLVFFIASSGKAAHVAVIYQRIGRPQATFIGVRNKDNSSPVFTASLTASYYTGQGWTPRIFTFPKGKPRLVLDTDPALANNPAYCQFDAGHFEGTIR